MPPEQSGPPSVGCRIILNLIIQMTLTRCCLPGLRQPARDCAVSGLCSADNRHFAGAGADGVTQGILGSLLTKRKKHPRSEGSRIVNSDFPMTLTLSELNAFRCQGRVDPHIHTFAGASDTRGCIISSICFPSRVMLPTWWARMWIRILTHTHAHIRLLLCVRGVFCT